MRSTIWATICLIVASIHAAPVSAAKIDDQFRAWLQADLWPDARAKGISQKTFEAAFDSVTPNLKLPDLVMPGEKPKVPKVQHQAEFGSPAPYFAEKTLAPVASGGRSRAGQYAATLAKSLVPATSAIPTSRTPRRS